MSTSNYETAPLMSTPSGSEVPFQTMSGPMHVPPGTVMQAPTTLTADKTAMLYSTGLPQRTGMSMNFASTFTTDEMGRRISGGPMAMSGQQRKVSSTIISRSDNVGQLPSGAIEQSSRKVSSVVIAEETIGKHPTEVAVKYVEVPVYQEVVKHVPKKEVREVERRVPKIEYEYVERITEVPQIQVVDKLVEVPQVQEIIRHVPKVEIVDRPYEVVKHIPKVDVRMVEKVVEVPGEIIEVPKQYSVEQMVPVTRYSDSEQALIVAQTAKPIVVETNEAMEVDVVEYEPEVVAVDIHVAKIVESQLIASAVDTVHRVVTIPAGQYNSILKFLNTHLSEREVALLPYMQEDNVIPFLKQNVQYFAPPDDVTIEGYAKGQFYSTGRVVSHNLQPAKQTKDAWITKTEAIQLLQQLQNQMVVSGNTNKIALTQGGSYMSTTGGLGYPQYPTYSTAMSNVTTSQLQNQSSSGNLYRSGSIGASPALPLNRVN